MMAMNPDAAWLRAKAEEEDNGIVSVGGLVCALARSEAGSKAQLAGRVALAKLVEPSRAEPGVQVYIPTRDPEDPAKFFIYEQYADEAAYTAHTETDHFKEIGFGDAIPRLLERKREFYVPMAD